MKQYLLVFSILLLAAASLAQTTEPQTPVTGVDTPANTPTPRYEDNVRPLSGVQLFDVGNRADRQNLFMPSFSFSQSYGTNPGITSGTAQDPVWGSISTAGASLRLLRGGAKQLFSMSYLGNAQFNYYNSDLNNNNHTLNVAETFTAGRWTFVLGDTVTYQANAFGAYAPLFFPGSTPQTPVTNFRPGTTPSDSIITQQNTQINNAAIGQLSYGLSRSSLITGSFSYGILHYLEGNLVDNRQLSATGGFDHRFGRNTVGLAYTFSRFMYDQNDESFDTNTVLFTYGRRIIGRLSMDLGVGPSFTVARSGVSSSDDIVGSGRINLQYVGTRTSFAVGYSRGITGGAGATTGALTDSVTGSLTRSLSRNLTLNVNGAYNRNSTLDMGIDYNTVVGGAGITRTVNQFISISAGYSGQWQTSNAGFNADFSSQAFVASINWHLRPIRLK